MHATRYTRAMNAEELRHRREELGLSQAELAAALDVRRQTITEWETGARHVRMATVLALALEALQRRREREGEGDDNGDS